MQVSTKVPIALLKIKGNYGMKIRQEFTEKNMSLCLTMKSSRGSLSCINSIVWTLSSIKMGQEKAFDLSWTRDLVSDLGCRACSPVKEDKGQDCKHARSDRTRQEEFEFPWQHRSARAGDKTLTLLRHREHFSPISPTWRTIQSRKQKYFQQSLECFLIKYIPCFQLQCFWDVGSEQLEPEQLSSFAGFSPVLTKLYTGGVQCSFLTWASVLSTVWMKQSRCLAWDAL